MHLIFYYFSINTEKSALSAARTSTLELTVECTVIHVKKMQIFLFFCHTHTLARTFSASTKVNRWEEKPHEQKKTTNKKLNDQEGLIQFQVQLKAHEIEFDFRERHNTEIKTKQSCDEAKFRWCTHILKLKKVVEEETHICCIKSDTKKTDSRLR